ncbi:MAG: NADH-quinone oxidoreductase subunit M [Deltaproteobacteria bacterium]|nr:NADH-quinone oxidoreductase subunit M [Deltaproteobacteria bacterium]
MADLPILSCLIAIPAVAGVLLAFVPPTDARWFRYGALVVTLIELALCGVAIAMFVPPVGSALALVEDHAWIEAFSIRYSLGVDGIALLMIALTGLILPMAVGASWTSIVDRPKGFFLALLFLESGMMGVFAAADLFLFYTFWEVMLIPMALLIGVWGGKNRVAASVKFVLYTLFGSLLMFVAILYVYGVSLQAGTPTFDIATLAEILPARVDGWVEVLLFWAFALAFAVKVPMFPVHTWLPDAHTEAPTAGSVILAGVLLKMGTYGFLRFAIPFFPWAAQWSTPAILALSAIGIVFGSFMCMVQTDIKRLVAYSSVAHLGFVMLGLFSGTVVGAQGGVLQMINHGISTGALFLLVGVLYERAHTRGVTDFGGLARTMPIYAVTFLIVTLSSIGLPGTNGFVGEFLILLGTWQRYPVAAAVGALGVVLGAVYMLTLYRNLFFGKARNPKFASFPEPNLVETATLVPLVCLIFLIGFFPNPLLVLTEAPVQRIVDRLQPGSDPLAGRITPAMHLAPVPRAPEAGHGSDGH